MRARRSPRACVDGLILAGRLLTEEVIERF